MNWNLIEGNCKQLEGSVLQQWGKPTDGQVGTIAGKRDRIAGNIQESYSLSKDGAVKQFAAWQERQK